MNNFDGIQLILGLLDSGSIYKNVNNLILPVFHTTCRLKPDKTHSIILIEPYMECFSSDAVISQSL